ncbi:hypothetical protein [Tuwongella immobilis]|uniref:hypothetical protein n=1 Tax=Tuwongella immobilis TaxID=692036 RepID=UPI001E3F7172|nr:hypothetical protein [Tuwongella immobilis]
MSPSTPQATIRLIAPLASPQQELPVARVEVRNASGPMADTEVAIRHRFGMGDWLPLGTRRTSRDGLLVLPLQDFAPGSQIGFALMNPSGVAQEFVVRIPE